MCCKHVHCLQKKVQVHNPMVSFTMYGDFFFVSTETGSPLPETKLIIHWIPSNLTGKQQHMGADILEIEGNKDYRLWSRIFKHDHDRY